MTSENVRARAALLGIIAVLAAWSWQSLTVRYNYGGNWTALFCIAPHMPVPDFLRSENLYIFQGSEGYDGQEYHLIAHDPWFSHGTVEGSAGAIVGPAIFYQRILVPALAWLVALGQDRWIHQAYYAVILAFLFLGVYWLSQVVARAGFHSAWGLAFLLTPAAITSLDRMTVDIALAAFTVGFVLFAAGGPNWKVFVVLACAMLTKEQAAPIAAGYALYLLTQKRLLPAIAAAASALPMLAWFLYLKRTLPTQPSMLLLMSLVPLAGVVGAIRHPVEYPMTPFKNAVGVAFDYVALAGFLIALALTVRLAIRRRWNPGASAAYALGISTLALGNRLLWISAYAFGRGLTPLYLLVAIEELSTAPWLGVLPMLLIDGRIGLNFVSQIQGIFHGLTGF
jgi:hypothetical protein